MEILRWLIICLCTAIYLGIVYLASLDFRGGQRGIPENGALAWSIAIVRHVVLIPGLLPLAIVIAWLLCGRARKTVLFGAFFVACALIYHYILFAISAHSDVAYPWFQLGELALTWFALMWLIRHRETNG